MTPFCMPVGQKPSEYNAYTASVCFCVFREQSCRWYKPGASQIQRLIPLPIMSAIVVRPWLSTCAISRPLASLEIFNLFSGITCAPVWPLDVCCRQLSSPLSAALSYRAVSSNQRAMGTALGSFLLLPQSVWKALMAASRLGFCPSSLSVCFRFDGMNSYVVVSS